MILNLLILNIVVILCLLVIPSNNIRRLKAFSLYSSNIIFIYSCALWVFFQEDIAFFQYFYESD